MNAITTLPTITVTRWRNHVKQWCYRATDETGTVFPSSSSYEVAVDFLRRQLAEIGYRVINQWEGDKPVELRWKFTQPDLWFQRRNQLVQDEQYLGRNCYRITELRLKNGVLWCGLQNVHTGEFNDAWELDSDLVSLA